MDASNELLSRARLLFEEGKTTESLEALKKAYEFYPDPKTAKKIERLSAVLKSEEAVLARDDVSNHSVVKLEAEARELFQTGDLQASLVKLQLALTLSPGNEKLVRRISRIKDALQQNKEQALDDVVSRLPEKAHNTLLDRLIQQTGNLSIQEESNPDNSTKPLVSENLNCSVQAERVGDSLFFRNLFSNLNIKPLDVLCKFFKNIFLFNIFLLNIGVLFIIPFVYAKHRRLSDQLLAFC